MSKTLTAGALLLIVIAALSSCQRIEDQDHIVCYRPGMEDTPCFYGDMQVRFDPQGEKKAWRRVIAVVWLRTPSWEMDRKDIERAKEIAAEIGGNGISLNNSYYSSDRKCLDAHIGRSHQSGQEETRWYPIKVVKIHQPRLWSQLPFYDPDPGVRFERVIAALDAVFVPTLKMGREMDWPEELILAESICWDHAGRINNLKSLYRAEADDQGDLDLNLALLLAIDDAHNAFSHDTNEVLRMSRYHEDDEFTDIYARLKEGLSVLGVQLQCEKALWFSRTGR